MLKKETYILSFALVLCCSLSAFGASNLTLSSSGGGIYQLQGRGVENVAAFDITINYDSATMANPRVDQGNLISGAMMAVNANLPGIVRIAIITVSPIGGDGVIATLTFNRIGDAAGAVTGLRAALSNLTGSPLPVVAQFNNQSSPATNTSSPSSNQGSTSTADAINAVPAPPLAGGSRNVLGGIVTSPAGTVIPAPEPERKVEKVKETPSVAEETISTTVSATQDRQGASKGKAVYTQKSVLNKFRELKGEPAPKALISLFDQEPLIGFKQEPPLALSDERSTVKVTFIALTVGKNIPEVTLTNAQFVSLERDSEQTNTWIAVLRPDKGVNSAAMIVLQDKVTMIFPLTVASRPKRPLEKDENMTEADFNRFLKERGSPPKLKYDLNGDGKRDYLDDYIFTANYLLSMANAKKTKR